MLRRLMRRYAVWDERMYRRLVNSTVGYALRVAGIWLCVLGASIPIWAVLRTGGGMGSAITLLAIVLFGTAMTLAFREQHRLRTIRLRYKAGLCPICGYDLRASPTRCPECGADATVPATSRP